MQQTWSLKEIYESFEDPQIARDLDALSDALDEGDTCSKALKDSASFEAYFKSQEKAARLMSKLSAFASLNTSANADNAQAHELMNKVQVLSTKSAPGRARYSAAIKAMDDVDGLIGASDYLKNLDFIIRKAKRASEHALSEAEETVMSKMSITGSNAWNTMFGSLLSSLMVDMPDGKQLPITVVRTLAANADPEVRKSAYFAEVKAYEKIDKAAAAALNAIKGEVLTNVQLRGYESPLQMTLKQTNITQGTLDAMMTAIRENLDVFRRYLRAKARYLGYNGPMPFYEIFAPVGENTKTYTHEEAEEIVLKSFRTFSEKLANAAKTAFDKNWIEKFPREGKASGAFCRALPFIGEFRILTNFNGTLGNITTLAHELGHGYHAIVAKDEHPLNLSYPMTLAETASTMCETIVTNDIFDATGSITILDSMLEGVTQVVVDIYSRFLFESRLFEIRKSKPLSVTELKNMMLEAQKEAYDDALDHNYLHPYMWANKRHYYGSNFYNFPYAFGQLFATGLYNKYLENPKDFLPKYDELLMSAGRKSVEDATMILGIDSTDPNFWRSSIKAWEGYVEKFEELVEKAKEDKAKK